MLVSLVRRSYASQRPPWRAHRAKHDKIVLSGMLFHGFHGVFESERALGQKFRVDLELHADLEEACRTDNVHTTVDYASVYREVQNLVESSRRSLLEALAEDITLRVFETQPRVSAVRTRVMKPHVAVSGVLEGLGVEIFRDRPGQG
mmetsp:Transcript_45653/g.74442  ORF Transcript_45653/g.74442 Transcript_45653/m.74442 type:complete len:147 (-) Transcript_45653:465-905(-)